MATAAEISEYDTEELETRLHRRLMAHPDAREGVVAYLERRPADWSGSLSTGPPDGSHA